MQTDVLAEKQWKQQSEMDGLSTPRTRTNKSPSQARTFNCSDKRGKKRQTGWCKIDTAPCTLYEFPRVMPLDSSNIKGRPYRQKAPCCQSSSPRTTQQLRKSSCTPGNRSEPKGVSSLTSGVLARPSSFRSSSPTKESPACLSLVRRMASYSVPISRFLASANGEHWVSFWRQQFTS